MAVFVCSGCFHARCRSKTTHTAVTVAQDGGKSDQHCHLYPKLHNHRFSTTAFEVFRGCENEQWDDNVDFTPSILNHPSSHYSFAGHLIYLYGDPAAANIGYVHMGANDQNFSRPIVVNSPGSAIAIGTVRGAHIALGRSNRIPIAWNGSSRAQPRGPLKSAPMTWVSVSVYVCAVERLYSCDGLSF